MLLVELYIMLLVDLEKDYPLPKGGGGLLIKDKLNLLLVY